MKSVCPIHSDVSAEMKQQISQGNAQNSKWNVVASKKSNDVAFSADICLGVTGTYDLNKQKSSVLPNSGGFGSVGGGVWKTGTIVVPIYKKER